MEHPILFNGEMVRAILEGRKSQTRRIIKPQPEYQEHMGSPSLFWNQCGGRSCSEIASYCPYGQPGDRLWVRESFSYHERVSDPYYLPADYPEQAMGVHFWADGNPEYGDWTRPKPSIFMPRWASRITLEVVNVRVERVQDISEEDAVAEGVICPDFINPRQAYYDLWDSINAKRGYGWDVNPWVWVVEFRRLEP